VGTRSRMCYGGGEVWVHGDWFVYTYYYSLIYFPLPPCFYLRLILTLLWDID